jgi:monoamine oxidase
MSHKSGYRTSSGRFRRDQRAYSYWKVGQYTAFAGAEREQSGNCHFAGEHASIDFQGFLNGAVESGYRAAGEILAGFK